MEVPPNFDMVLAKFAKSVVRPKRTQVRYTEQGTPIVGCDSGDWNYYNGSDYVPFPLQQSL